MLKKISGFLCFTLAAISSNGQQFVGLSLYKYASVQQLPYNPAVVNDAIEGTQIHIFSVSAFGGNNAYRFTKDYITGGLQNAAVEGKDYDKDLRKSIKHGWVNIDVLGPSASFVLKDNIQAGVYTRMRQIVRMGNISSTNFRLIGNFNDTLYNNQQLTFADAGFSTHTFAEVGITLGKVLSNDYYNRWRGGITIKYLMGFSAGTLYASEIDYTRKSNDSLGQLKGDFTALYSHNIGAFADGKPANDLSSWFYRDGKGGLGFDIGIQYEYHSDGDPNRPTPYVYSIGAAITDIGGITYFADSNAGTYTAQITNERLDVINKRTDENHITYLTRLQNDSLINRTERASSFRMGLPTALRLNGDWNFSSNFYVQANIILNLKGNNGAVYRPAYVSMLNITPRYEKKEFMVGFPFTFSGFQNFSIGTVLRAGPFFVGSSSVISTIIGKQIRNADGYAGLVFKLDKERQRY